MKKQLNTELEKIAYNCRKATLLMEKKQDITLTEREKIELKIHLAGCHICKIYEKQSSLINSMMKMLLTDAPKNLKLNNSFKHQLQNRINNVLAEKDEGN